MSDDRRYLEVQERMLRSGDQMVSDSHISPYWDPALKNNQRNYRKFIHKLNSVGYLDFTLSPCQHAGVFFVWKSDKQKIRMIIDARPANAVFQEPPGVALATAETFSKIEVDFGIRATGQAELLGPPFGLHVGLSDVKDCFHRIRQPRWLSRYFCLMPIEARHVGLTGKLLDGQVLQSSDLVYPMPGSLCMGFSWSLYFAQRISERQMSLVPSLKDSSLVNDRSGPAVFPAEAPSSMKHFVYVDNLGVMSGSVECVAQGLTGLTEQFTNQNLLLHPGEIQHSKITALGIEMDGQQLLTRVATGRFHRVRQGLRHLLRWKRCTGRALEVIVGHCTYCGLVNRCTLSVFHNVYKFIKSSYTTSSSLWPSVLAELRAFAGMMPALRADWSRAWSREVVVSDASEEGFGVCRTHWDSSSTGRVGRCSERDRFKRSGGHNARESALSAAGFVRDEVTGRWISGELGDEDYLEAAGWRLDASFPEVPAHQLKSSEWVVARQARWSRPEHIVHLEARALVKSMEVAVHDCGSFDARQLLLVDSMSAALAFDRCRSRNYRLLRQIRKFCSYSIGCNVGFAVRWIPSEINPADEPSRVFPTVPQTCKSRLPPHLLKPLSYGAKEKSGVVTSLIGPKGKPPPLSGPFSANDGEAVRQASQSTELGAAEAPERGKVDAASTCRKGQAGGSPGHHGEFSQEAIVRQRGQLDQLGPPGSLEETAVVGSQEQEALEEVRGRDDGTHVAGIEFVGEKGNQCQFRTVLQPGIHSTEGLHLRSAARLCDHGAKGCWDQCILQPPFPGGLSSSPRRKDTGIVYAPSPGLQPVWIAETSSDLSGPQGLAKTESRNLAKGMAPVRVECSGLRDETSRSPPDGAVHHVGPGVLLKTERTPEVSSLLPCQAYALSYRSLVLATEPRRAAREVQGGRVRRLSCPRLSLSQALGSTAVAAPEVQASNQPVVGLRLWSVYEGLRPDRQADEYRPHSVSASTLRTKHRPKQERSIAPGGSKERPMEVTQECGKVREVRPTCSQLPSHALDSAAALPCLRGTSRGCVARPGPRSKDAYVAKGLKGQYVADLFSGHGGVAKQCRRLGYMTREWELAHDNQFDLTKPSVLRKLKQDIDRSQVIAAMLAPPCSSFSVARDRTCVIRTKDFPWGLPSSMLSSSDQEKVRVGNACFRAALQIIKRLNVHRVPWILENPVSSKCWYLPQLSKLEASPLCTVVISDFCQFGTLWRKRTKFLCGNLDTQDVARIGRLCRGRGVCDRTGRQHFQLTGSNHQGVPWTHIAQPYPTLLCKQLAFSLTAPSHY